MEQVSNNPQFAIEYFNSAIEKNLNRPEAFFGRGVARLVLKRYALATKDFDLALEADWQSISQDVGHWIQEFSQGRSLVHLYRAKAGMGLLGTIDAKKETETYFLTLGRIYMDLDFAEMHAGSTGNSALIKEITRVRHFFEKLPTPKIKK